MTRSAKATVRKTVRSESKARVRKGYWIFQDAKARLSEVVRRARSEGVVSHALSPPDSRALS